MTLFRWATALAVCAGLTTAAGAATPLDVYGGLPTIEQVEISPDGSLLAVAVTDGERRMLSVRKVDDLAAVAALQVGDDKFRSIDWVGSDYLVVTTSQTAQVRGLIGPKREFWVATGFDLTTRKQHNLLAQQENSMNVIVGDPIVRRFEGKPALYLPGVNFVDNRGQIGLFRVFHKSTGKSRLVEAGEPATMEWLLGPDGDVLAQSEYVESTGKWGLRFKVGGGWRSAAERVSPYGAHNVVGLGRDPKSALVYMPGEDGEHRLTEFAVDREPEVIEGDFERLIRDRSEHVLVGGSALVGEETRYTFFDPKADASWKAVRKAFPGDRVTLASWSADKRRIVAHVDSATAGPAYALVDLDAKSARWLGDVYSALTPEGVSEVRPVRYKARDGLEITGYLTLPKGRKPQKLPLIVLPHGGPASRDEPGFDFLSQGLASRGYAVLQPNFRGSTGFGRAFLEAGFGQWGKAMQTDLSDGVRHLAAEGIVDAARVCIAGASYGGYAALAGVTIETGVYRCAASVAGVSDLRRMIGDVNSRYGTSRNSARRYWTDFMGGSDERTLSAISPVFHAQRITVPVLLVHGKDDTVVNYEQSRIMAEAMTKAGKPVKLVTLDGEDHWLSRGATRKRMLTELVSFLETHNPPG